MPSHITALLLGWSCARWLSGTMWYVRGIAIGCSIIYAYCSAFDAASCANRTAHPSAHTIDQRHNHE